MRNVVIATIKSANIVNAEEFKKKYQGLYSTTIIKSYDQLTLTLIKELNPEFIFFPHWSWVIPDSIYENYNCIVFHMTDLPYGRGGSPIQNLILRHHKETKISAIRVVKGIDQGPVLIKSELDLSGTADDIIDRFSTIVFEDMIPAIMNYVYDPIEQTGEPTYFKRRKPDQSLLPPDLSVSDLHDFIRMLDGEGYPAAYIEYGDYLIEFTNPEPINGNLKSEVLIRRKNEKDISGCCSSR